jgi:hypothetical protein
VGTPSGTGSTRSPWRSIASQRALGRRLDVPAGDAASVRLALGPRERVLRYRALACEIASTAGPAGAVFESVAPDPTPWITVRPANLVRTLGLPSFPAGPCGGWCSAPEPPRTLAVALDRVGVIVPDGATEEPASGLPALEDPSPILRPDRGDWLATQTFWVRGDRGGVWAARRFRFASADAVAGADRAEALARSIARDWTRDLGSTTVRVRGGFRSRRSWRARSVDDVPGGAWVRRDDRSLAATAEVRVLGPASTGGAGSGHAVVFGASGAGKTTYLARRAAEAITRGLAVVVLDLHGDLAPAIVARLGPAARPRVVAVDAGDPPVPGVSALPSDPDEDRVAAVLVAAVKRLSADGTDVYWGFRLERIYDSFVRLVLESGGTIVDLFDLLTNEERREAARLATRRPALARFLDELRPVVRRNPDFLWSAATRLSKVVLVPALAQLLAPPDGGLPVEELLGGGHAVLVRLPIARLGPEAASLAGTLILARLFLGLAGRAERAGNRATPVLVVLDEVQGFSPRLVAEVLAESRKYGLRVIVATQYPERLAPEVKSAAAGASTQFVSFRVPPPAAEEAGAWLGLERTAARSTLPELPPGRGIEIDPETGRLAAVAPERSLPFDMDRAWSDVVDRTRALVGAVPDARNSEPGPAVERLLLAVLGAEDRGAPLAPGAVPDAAEALPGPALDRATLAETWTALVRRGWVAEAMGAVRLTEAGARAVGLTVPTGAVRETAEHRRLLMHAFRVFARRGYRLDILRQGRFDTTLPDARFRQLPAEPSAALPRDLADELDRARTGWAWRYFGGRDVDVEAEVSGATRVDRVRHACAKAERRGAVVLFVVGNPAHARRIRANLARLGIGRDRAIVWTLRSPLGPPAPPVRPG